MGNVCCKRRGYEPIDNANTSGQREKTDTTGQGDKTDTTGQREKTDATGQREKDNTGTNLELYLNDVFEKECIFKIEQDEIGFIQTGIETLVQELVDNVLKSETLGEHFKNMLDKRCGFRGIVEEVYFPIKPESIKVNVIPGRQSIIKVGSIYEGTKNNFPDEFDFIFPLLSLTDVRYTSLWPFLKAIVEKCICSVTGSLCYVPSTEIVENERKLYFDKYMNRHGPAYMLRFIYNNGSGEERYIHVDLVPAYKVNVDPSDSGKFTRNVDERVKPKAFKDETFPLRNNILIVRQDLSLTEAEVHFVRNILSQNHKVVYRVLKFLFNGHEDHAALEQFMDKCENSDKRGTEYSSYMIKTMMFYHHEECTNSDPAIIGPCVLQVLEEMCKHDNVLHFPTNLKTHSFKSSNIFLLSGLKSLTACLKSMQTSDDSYCYERMKMKSVTRQYLDTLIKLKD